MNDFTLVANIRKVSSSINVLLINKPYSIGSEQAIDHVSVNHKVMSQKKEMVNE